MLGCGSQCTQAQSHNVLTTPAIGGDILCEESDELLLLYEHLYSFINVPLIAGWCTILIKYDPR